ncbi:MAG TPA: hypothetical protein VH540_25245 [Ktedonobacterales bacterium]|jgi:hypothetical protein
MSASSNKIRLDALLSLVGDTILFLSLPLNYTTTTYSTMGGLGETTRQWSTTQTTWNYYFAGLLQADAGAIGPVIVVTLVLFLLSLPTLSVLCLVRPLSQRLSATGVTFAGACLCLWFLSACNSFSSNQVSFGPTTTLTHPGPGTYLVPLGLFVAAGSMIRLHRQVREQLRGQRGTRP